MAKRVLVVNQSTNIRKALKNILRGESLQVVEVTTGEEALAYCDYDLPHCIFLEKNLPEIDGIEFINFFNYNHPNVETKIILCIEESENVTLEEINRFGAHGFASAPFDQKHIHDSLTDLNVL